MEPDMTIIVTPENFHDLVGPIQGKFWGEVDWLVSAIMDGDRGIVRRYEQVVRNAPVAEQMLVYHEAPLHLALDLLGQVTLTEKQRDMLASIGGKEWGAIAEELKKAEPVQVKTPGSGTLLRYLEKHSLAIALIGAAVALINLVVGLAILLRLKP
jgi:hypothetical protein